MSKTPRTESLEDGIIARRRARGFGMPEDLTDALALARQLETELAAARG